VSQVPVVSIFLPVYNSASFIEETLASILNQDMSAFEVIVIDDHSSDATVQKIKKISQDDPRVKIHLNSKNEGVGRSYGWFLRLAQGRFAAQIGHDDVWGSGFLRSSVEALEREPDVVATFSSVELISETGSPAKWSPVKFEHECLYLDRYNLFLRLLSGNFLCAASSVFRLEQSLHLSRVGHTDYFQDWFTWLALIQRGRFKFIPQIFVKYRIHRKNLSHSNYSWGKAFVEKCVGYSGILEDSLLPSFIHSSASQSFLSEFILSYLEAVRAAGGDSKTAVAGWIQRNRYALTGNESLGYVEKLIWSSMGRLEVFSGIDPKDNYLCTRSAWVMLFCPRALWKKSGKIRIYGGQIQFFGPIFIVQLPLLGIGRDGIPLFQMYFGPFGESVTLGVEGALYHARVANPVGRVLRRIKQRALWFQKRKVVRSGRKSI
jgi:glycosyltransferase involved in cell wall biosynthesis